MAKRTPKAKATKQPTKLAAQAVDGYEAAAFSRNRSTIWTTTPEKSANPSPFTRAELLRNARYLVKNLPILERALSAVEANAVGGGLFANAITEDKEFNKAATKAFDKWAHSVFCTVDNDLSLFDVQKLIARELIVSGECFIVLQKAKSGYPQITLVNSERVRQSGKKEDTSIDGLWVNEVGKVEAYNVFFGNTCQKIPADSIIHLKRAKEVGALRGICSFAASQNSCRDILDSIGIEKVAIKAHSLIATAIIKKGGEATSGLLGGGIPIDSATPTAPTNRRLESPFPGANIILDENEDIKLLAGDRIKEGFKSFIELLTREVCLNLNLSYDYLISPKDLNGVGVRFVIADCDATFRDIQDRIIDGGMMRLYRWVISVKIADRKDALQAPKSGDPYEVNFIRPLRLTVDTTRVSSSDIALVQNGMLTLAEYYSQRGKLWTEELAQVAHEQAFKEELGLTTAQTPSPAPKAPADDKKERA